MTDDELAEELRINQPQTVFKEGVRVVNNPDRNIDIRKTWSSASKTEKGYALR